MSALLTYSLSSSSPVTIFPLQKIASANLASSFWNFTLKSGLNLNEYDTGETINIRLANHREETIRTSNDFIEKNKLPSYYKTILKESILSINHAYHQMLLWKKKYDSSNRINLFQRGELYGTNYFTVDGEFNDLIWAKRLVLKSNLRLDHRFYLACYYCLDNETVTLWEQIKNSKYFIGVVGSLEYIKAERCPLIALRVFQLENQLSTLAQDRKYKGNIWEVGLRKAVSRGYEHATYYFWQNLSEPERISIIENDSFFDLLSDKADYPYDKISYFFYSQLSEERKRDLLDWTIANQKSLKLLNLLITPYTQPVRSEIIKLFYKLPIKTSSCLFQYLSTRIMELKLPYDSEVFQLLWSKYTQAEKHDILKKQKLIISCLVRAKDFFNVGHIIKGLSLKQKRKCLFEGFNTLYGAGVTCFGILVRKEEFDFLQTYLSFFLIERDPITQKETLRKDANSFLQKFIESRKFLAWCEKELSSAEVEKIKGRVAELQAIITLLKGLCEKVCIENNVPRSSTGISRKIFKKKRK